MKTQNSPTEKSSDFVAQSKTKWKTISKVEIVYGDKIASSAPYPEIRHEDEVELMSMDTWEEAKNV